MICLINMMNRIFDKRYRSLRLGRMVGFLIFNFCLLIFSSCQKIEYTTMESPAYLRVFNSLNTIESMENKGEKVPYLCMLINPELDANGIPVSAEIVGDFLDQRDVYAPPYPSHIGVSTTVNNPEYPGKETVLAGPMLNGYDLSSWAQVPSGEMRVMFYYRPVNGISFFDLTDDLKQDIATDASISLSEGEVYTLHVLQKDFVTKENGILLRQENFHKQALSDSLVYANFYNYSAKGYWQADRAQKAGLGSNLNNKFTQGIRDTMNVFLTLYTVVDTFEQPRDWSYEISELASPEYVGKYLTTIVRTTESGQPSPYVNFPLWIGKNNGVYTRLMQYFIFGRPGLDWYDNAFHLDGGWDHYHLNESSFADLFCFYNSYHYNLYASQEYMPYVMPNLVVTTRSGNDNPRSFATVNSIEVINGLVYLTTVQRQYAPPIY